MRTLFIHVRKSIKLMIILIISLLLILGILYFLFRPMYAVKLNGELIGYVDTKKQLEEKIEDYKKSGDGDKVAFYEIDQMPDYEVCYSKKDVQPDEEKVFDTVISSGTPYYRSYAIMYQGEEKAYVSSSEEAEQVINDLKEKNSTNVNDISYVAKYSSDELEQTAVENVVASLYVAPQVVQNTVETPTIKQTTTTVKRTALGTVNTSQNVSFANKAIGVSLARPVSGTITSRFGRRSRGMHTGLDIATTKGTPIGAAAAGTVTYAGPKGTYGNLVVIDHGNGVQTYYAHCSSVCCSAGQTVSQGQIISKVGSTGNSTGPHLHLEIRINGVCQNPQNYLY